MDATNGGDRLGELKRVIAGIEGRRVISTAVGAASVEGEGGAGLAFGLDDVDRRLGTAGGLAFGALHEVVCDEAREAGAVSGFAAALLARLLDRRGGRVLWIATAEARRETGRLAARGLGAFGLDPGRVVEVAVERVEEALWAFEEGLGCRATTAVVAEIPDRSIALDLTATRRLALRAARGAVAEAAGFGLLLRVGGRPQTTAAATRWRVAALPSRALGDFAPGVGRPSLRLDLEKNRDGRLGRFAVEWSPHERRFVSLPAHSLAAPAVSADRPAATQGGARVLAFERSARGG
ncbi:MAG: DNA repair protein [Siculibacillus sp.]